MLLEQGSGDQGSGARRDAGIPPAVAGRLREARQGPRLPAASPARASGIQP